jgi:methyl-accepting chemotaxis protein
MLNNMKVSVRLALLAGLLVLLMVIIGIMGIQSTSQSNDAMSSVYKDRVIPLKELKLIADLYAVNIVDMAHKVRNKGASWQQGADSVTDASKNINTLWNAFLATDLVAEETSLVNELKPLLVTADNAKAELLQILSAQDAARLDAFVLNKLYPSIEPVSDRFNKLVDVQLSVAEKAYQASMISYERAFMLNIACIIFSILVSITLGYAITRSLLRQLGGEPNYTAQIVEQVANGDLSVRAQLASNDQSSILYAINQMIMKLSSIINDVRSTANSLSAASEEVSATAQSLSQSATEQAASAEETSASMEEISASISQNNDNARVTDGMATQSAKEAIQGGEAVKNTVSAMQKIAEKISVIDDIAYQTNLLALNAAIEAGRAGEHGRGFAVVASEVRKLAGRSQTAAKEIGELASSSVTQAVSAGDLLNQMVPSIKKTADLVQEISAASQQQSIGANHITTAISQISIATQHNSSASEELYATAEELSHQASQLQEMMEFFKLAQNR